MGVKVGFDAGMLILLLQEGANAPADPLTNQPIGRARERIELLKTNLSEERTKIVLPTPALSEFLVGAGVAIDSYLDVIHSDSCFEVAPFSERAAIEAAIVTYQAKSIYRASKDDIAATWQHVKVDVQIMAIAKISGVSVLYTTDGHLSAYAELFDLKVLHLADLPLPPDNPQRGLDFDKPKTNKTEPEAAEVRGGGDGPTEGQAAAEGEG